MASERRFVLVISPAWVKPILDGSKCVIIYPGATDEQLEKFRAALDDLQTKPDLSMLAIKPGAMDVEVVQAKKVREIRAE